MSSSLSQFISYALLFFLCILICKSFCVLQMLVFFLFQYQCLLLFCSISSFHSLIGDLNFFTEICKHIFFSSFHTTQLSCIFAFKCHKVFIIHHFVIMLFIFYDFHLVMFQSSPQFSFCSSLFIWHFDRKQGLKSKAKRHLAYLLTQKRNINGTGFDFIRHQRRLFGSKSKRLHQISAYLRHVSFMQAQVKAWYTCNELNILT